MRCRQAGRRRQRFTCPRQDGSRLVTLNKAQQQVADHREGALVVSAGPGSGKTYVLVGKVISLVNSGVAQSSILCMTFTEKAASEMKERLEKKGIVDAKVCTFHAFSREVIEDSLIESGAGQKARTFLRPLQMAWCLRNTDRFGLDPRYVKIGNDWNALYGAMLEAISRFKQETVGHERLQEFVDSRIAACKSGDADPDEMDDDAKAAYRLNELNKVYRAYEEYKAAENFMDFEDMVYGAVTLLRDDKDMLRRYQEEFQYVMIDEFQDNNYSQLEMVKLLGGHGNVTVVGDRDQSIMRFQGSYGEVFGDFQRTYPDRQEIKLVQNYRSTKNIIRIANQILGKAGGDAQGHTENEDGKRINVVFADTDKAQAEYVAGRIRKLVGSKVSRRDGTESPVRYKDVAVLARRKAEGNIMAHELRSRGIPAVFVGNTEIRSNQVVLDLVAYLKVMHTPETAGMEIFRVLRGHGVSEQNIAGIYDVARRAAWEADDMRDDCVMKTMRECGGLDITQKSAILEIARHLDRLAEESRGVAIGDLVLKIAGEDSGTYKKLLASGDARNIQVLNKFCKIAEEYQDVFPGHGLGDFLQYLPILNQNGIETEDEEPEDAVNVMTMHKSKGKEFPIVFILDMADRRFPTRYTERQFSIPEELRHDGKTGDSREEHEAEERRLFYVSATRAMNMLHMVCPERYGKNVGASKPSKFLVDLECEANPLINFVRFAGTGQGAVQAQNPKEQAAAEMQRLATDAIHDMLPRAAVQRIVNLAYMEHHKKFGTADGFDLVGILDVSMDDMVLPADPKQDAFNHEGLTLSASSIKSYERCPLQFKFSKIMRIPQHKNAALDLGTVIHKIAEEFGKKKINHQKYGLDDGIKMFRNEWKSKPYRGGISEDSITERAEKILDNYLKWDRESKNTLLKTEEKFSTHIGGVKFTGKIDRLEENQDGEYEVVDFKTGKNKLSMAQAGTDPQMNIYAEAVRAKHGRLPARASLVYPELDKVVEYDITGESVKKSIESIAETVNDILKGNFEATPGSACRQCGYASICESRAY